ncbi:levanase, partial [mine drainage metagenome]
MRPWLLGTAVLGTGLAAGSAQAAAHAARLSGYNQIYRPQVHFSARRHWMNDPNGLVYYDGWYQMFFQYNPYGRRWGNMSWGHARSRDLLHWQQLPVAIPESRRFMIFSGSAVVDWHDTSGFGVHGRPPLVAIYTAQPRAHRGPQTENLAYTHRSAGGSGKNYSGNPVLNIGLRNFRDPKVLW